MPYHDPQHALPWCPLRMKYAPASCRGVQLVALFQPCFLQALDFKDSSSFSATTPRL